ncbi:MAG: hypothetical protein LBH57_04525 [Treponema sp.]|jgi:hypothetical protein|nr:hypothetical protein [Treponema sp.]
MGLAVALQAQYENAVRKMFPQGAYWEAQFADPQSDVSLFVKSKAEELFRFRRRMSALLDEGRTETTDELIGDWERVLLGQITYGKTLTERRLLLKSKEGDRLNRAELQKIAALYGLTLQDVVIPYRPRFFGFARFTQERIGSFTAFSVLQFFCTDADFARHWQPIKTELERGRFARLHFARDRLAHFPIYKMREIVYRKLRRGCFGYGRFACNRLAPFPLDEARRIIGERLDAQRITRQHFGQSRLVLFSRRFDPRLVLDQNYFGWYIAEILQRADFYHRFFRAVIESYFYRAGPYYDFEKAIGGKLLANHIPYFHYEGV